MRSIPQLARLTVCACSGSVRCKPNGELQDSSPYVQLVCHSMCVKVSADCRCLRSTRK